MTTCYECQGSTPDDSRFCIECGTPVVAIGATEKLKPIAPDPLGWLMGEPIYEYDSVIWCDTRFAINRQMTKRLSRGT